VRRIILSPEVSQAIPEDILREIYAGPAPAEFICMACRTKGNINDGDEVSVSVEISPTNLKRIIFAHGNHLHSQVFYSEDDSLGHELKERATDIVSVAGILPGKPVRAMMYFEQAVSFYTVDGTNGLDAFLTQLLQRGLYQIDSLVSTPPVAEGWVLEIGPDGTGQILDSDDAVVMDALPPLPKRWMGVLAGTNSEITLFASRVGMNGLTDLDRHLSGSLMMAAKRGALVGATIVVSLINRADTPAEHDRRIRAELAHALESALSETAFPEHDERSGPLSKMPNVVALPGSHRIEIIALQTASEIFPCLVLDLNVKSKALATGILRDLEREGLSRMRAFDGPFPLASPEKWSHVTWRAQILVMAGKTTAGENRKLLFEQVGVSDAYAIVGASAAQNLGLLIGNFQATGGLTLSLVKHEMRAGGVVGAAITGILAG
jgi:hypothetical protein